MALVMRSKTTSNPKLYFSYSQFLVYDESVKLPGCAWTDRHSAQGFARRESTVCFGSILEFGYANVVISQNFYRPNKEFKRVIAVPFLVMSGNVVVDGPEEMNTDRSVTIPPGNYRLIAAQCVVGNNEEAIDLFFETVVEPLTRSIILVADEKLSPSASLLETAEIAG